MKTPTLLLSSLLVLGAHSAVASSTDPCAYFEQVLTVAPHHKLSRRDGVHVSIWDKRKRSGCEIEFAGDDPRRTPSFHAEEGSELFRAGWRRNGEIAADGPGETLFAVDNGATQCLIWRSQPASLNEKTGAITRAKMLSIKVQCGPK